MSEDSSNTGMTPQQSEDSASASEKNAAKRRWPYAFLVLLLGLSALIVGQLVGIIIVAIFLGADLTEIYQQSADPSLIFINFIVATVSYLITIFLIIYFVRRYEMKDIASLGLKKPKSGFRYISVVTYFFYYYVYSILASILIPLLIDINIEEQQITGFEGAQNSVLTLGLAFITLVILAPIAEEILFRGFIYTRLKRYTSQSTAIVLSALVFSLAHWQPNVMIDTFVIGIFLAMLYERADSVWPSIALHAIKNFLAFSFLFLLS